MPIPRDHTSSMGPPLISFPVSELEKHVKTDERGKARKPPVKLEECELYELTQYCCDVENRNSKRPYVLCKPLLRLFRR